MNTRTLALIVAFLLALPTMALAGTSGRSSAIKQQLAAKLNRTKATRPPSRAFKPADVRFRSRAVNRGRVGAQERRVTFTATAGYLQVKGRATSFTPVTPRGGPATRISNMQVTKVGPAPGKR